MLRLLFAIAKKVGADLGSDPDLRVLKEATPPEKLIEQIDESMKLSDHNKRVKDQNAQNEKAEKES